MEKRRVSSRRGERWESGGGCRCQHAAWLRRGEAGELVYTLVATHGRGSGKLVLDVLAKERDDMPFVS